jgi:hypothetical protein
VGKLPHSVEDLEGGEGGEKPAHATYYVALLALVTEEN